MKMIFSYISRQIIQKTSKKQQYYKICLFKYKVCWLPEQPINLPISFLKQISAAEDLEKQMKNAHALISEIKT